MAAYAVHYILAESPSTVEISEISPKLEITFLKILRWNLFSNPRFFEGLQLARSASLSSASDEAHSVLKLLNPFILNSYDAPREANQSSSQHSEKPSGWDNTSSSTQNYL